MLHRRPMPFWIAGRNAAPAELCPRSVQAGCLQRPANPQALSFEPFSSGLPLPSTLTGAGARNSSGYPPA
jgi:hypothetical protein